MVTKHSRKSRYLSAAISPDGSKIAAFENTIQNKNNLVILDAGTSDVLKVLPTPGNISLQHPQWSPEGDKDNFCVSVAKKVRVYVLSACQTRTGRHLIEPEELICNHHSYKK